jgi:pimeloyl-ACP methyl ester carboxylesterase
MTKFYNTMTASKELFQSIHCSVLLIAGERDMNAPLATVIAAYQMIPNSQLSIIPNAPHPVFLVNFPAVWESIVPYLKE